MSYDIFERISTSEIMDFSNGFTSQYNFFAKYLPEIRTSNEYIEITDYDIDYNPSAELVGDNTVAPLAQRPTYEGKVQTLETYKLKHELNDSELRKLKSAATNSQKEEALRLVFQDQARLQNAHAIARERWRVQALFEGNNDFKDENFRPAPYDYGIPQDQFIDIDLTADDILEKLTALNKLASDRTGKNLGVWLLSKESIFKLQRNESLRAAAWGTTNKDARVLTESELASVLQLAHISFVPIQDEQGNNYHYTNKQGKQNLFVPVEKSVLLPNISLGATVSGLTAEEITLSENGYKLTNNNGVIIFPVYSPTPVHFELNSVSRFTVVYPKAPCSVILKDTSDPVSYASILASPKKVIKKPVQ